MDSSEADESSAIFRVAASGLVASALLAVLALWLDGGAYESSDGLHQGVELVICVIAVVAGGVFIARFLALGERFELIVGLAFVVGGAEDFLHGVVPFAADQGWISPDADQLLRFLPTTFVSGRLLMAVGLAVAALGLRGALGQARDPRREAWLGGAVAVGVALLVTGVAFAADVQSTARPGALIPRPLDLTAGVLFAGAAAWLWIGRRRGSAAMVGWVALTAATAAVGEFVIATSDTLYDAAFDLGHAFKLAAYVLPLVGVAHTEMTTIVQLRTASEEQALLSRQLTRSNDELQRYADDLAEANRALATSNNELEQFAYLASHDLQEPLRMVGSFVGRLAERYDDVLDDRGRQYVAFAVDGAERMQDLIESLLRYSRVGRRTLESQPSVDPASLLDDVTTSIAQVIADAGAEVRVGDLPHLKGDPVLLRQMLQNLVTNAIKFSSPDLPPVIEVSGHRDGDMVVLSVADNGIGIPPDQRDEVFALFRRLNPRQQFEGTGIGLALVHRIVDRHGGRVWITDRPDGASGTVFHVAMPQSLDLTDPAVADSATNARS